MPLSTPAGNVICWRSTLTTCHQPSIPHYHIHFTTHISSSTTSTTGIHASVSCYHVGFEEEEEGEEGSQVWPAQWTFVIPRGKLSSDHHDNCCWLDAVSWRKPFWHVYAWSWLDHQFSASPSARSLRRPLRRRSTRWRLLEKLGTKTTCRKL